MKAIKNILIVMLLWQSTAYAQSSSNDCRVGYEQLARIYAQFSNGLFHFKYNLYATEQGETSHPATFEVWADGARGKLEGERISILKDSLHQITILKDRRTILIQHANNNPRGFQQPGEFLVSYDSLISLKTKVTCKSTGNIKELYLEYSKPFQEKYSIVSVTVTFNVQELRLLRSVYVIKGESGLNKTVVYEYDAHSNFKERLRTKNIMEAIFANNSPRAPYQNFTVKDFRQRK